MSFGYRDEDWVDPDEQPAIRCDECEYWSPCPCGCDYGWCAEIGDLTPRDLECE